MNAFARCLIWLALVLQGPLTTPAWAAELVLLIDTATEMPMQHIVDGKLLDGAHKDIGDALASHLGRQARYLALPRLRIARALEDGVADVLCGYVPEWLPGPFDWSRPFIPAGDVVITDSRAPRPLTLKDLAGQRIGTVHGYVYRELEESLGPDFVRDDGPNSEANLRKLASGRFAHAVLSKGVLEYRLKLQDPPLSLHPPLVLKEVFTRCAVSRRGHVSVEEVDRAITAMVSEDLMTKVAQRYR
jgi:ABC-type amino acid transport substrate-binding protein